MEIEPKWKNHPLTKQGFVELVPTGWLFQMHGTDVTPLADLVDGTTVNLEALWDNMLHEGLHDPLIIRIGILNKKFRLESGNHRIQVLQKYGVKYTPATVEIQDECGPHANNVMTDASHNFDFSDNVEATNLVAGYMKPSQVFRHLHQNTKPF